MSKAVPQRAPTAMVISSSCLCAESGGSRNTFGSILQAQAEAWLSGGFPTLRYPANPSSVLQAPTWILSRRTLHPPLWCD